MEREAAALSISAGALYNEEDLARWRERIAGNRYLHQNDVWHGSPGDWDRILANANRFRLLGEAPATEANRAGHGNLARDAAFLALVKDDYALARLVGQYLLNELSAEHNDFAGHLCLRNLDDSARDGFFEEAPWLLRHVVAYDYVRRVLPVSERLRIENYLRRQAYFFAAHIDWGLHFAFPQRLVGDYSRRTRDAAPPTDAATWYARRFDTNLDCAVDASDDTRILVVHSYIDAQGTIGPRLSNLSQWWNNRRAANVVAYAAVGVLQGDSVLLNRAKRYLLEWLTYAVYSDGSEGEFSRNGDYCVPKQGLQYAQANLQAATFTAHWLHLTGDNALLDFSTREGLFGTEVSATAPPKSLRALVDHRLRLSNQVLNLYMHEPWRSSQHPRAETHLGRPDIRYLNQARPMDTYHELGLLQAATSFRTIPVAKRVLRDPTYTKVPKPGTLNSRIDTGINVWSDVFGALPAVLLLYAP